MRKSATWMQLVDERILEHLDRVVWSSAEMMVLVSPFEELQSSANRLEERLEVLAQAGLVAHVSGEWFEITGEGERYLEGRLDAKYLVASTG